MPTLSKKWGDIDTWNDFYLPVRKLNVLLHRKKIIINLCIRENFPVLYNNLFTNNETNENSNFGRMVSTENFL